MRREEQIATRPEHSANKSTPWCVCMSWLIGVYNKKTSLASVYSNNHHRRPGKLHIIGRRRRRVDPGRLLSM